MCPFATPVSQSFKTLKLLWLSLRVWCIFCPNVNFPSLTSAERFWPSRTWQRDLKTCQVEALNDTWEDIITLKVLMGFIQSCGENSTVDQRMGGVFCSEQLCCFEVVHNRKETNNRCVHRVHDRMPLSTKTWSFHPYPCGEQRGLLPPRLFVFLRQLARCARVKRCFHWRARRQISLLKWWKQFTSNCQQTWWMNPKFIWSSKWRAIPRTEWGRSFSEKGPR